MKILHIGTFDKFTAPFWRFLTANFQIADHLLLYKATDGSQSANGLQNLETGNVVAWVYKFFKHTSKAEKIIIHGLFDPAVVLLLFLRPSVLKKCYWVMWGGDLYYFQNSKGGVARALYEKLRASVIKRIGHLVTYIEGDLEIARSQYKITGQYHECIMYLSHVVGDYQLPQSTRKDVAILAGNSADPSNNHSEIFSSIKKSEQKNIRVYCPLSYGDPETAAEVKEEGKALFGDRFIPLTKFMPFEDYLKLLGEIEIAVFAHKRQQAMGNTVTLLGLGKKVFMRNDVSQWEFFNDMGVKVFDIDCFDLDPLNDARKIENQQKIRAYFSQKNLENQWAAIFND